MIQRIQFLSLFFAALSLVMLHSTIACAQSSTRGESNSAQDGPPIVGPENPMKSPAAPAAPIAPLDETLTKGAPTTEDVDSFLANKAQPIPDADRQPALPTDLDPPEHSQQNSIGSISLEARVKRLEAMLEAQSATLEEIRAAQAATLPSEELKKIHEEIVALRNSFQSVARPELGGEATSAQTFMPARGMLVVENMTQATYTMNVNGVDVLFMPGRWQIEVPVGRIVTEIRGYEAPRTWTAENFRQVGEGQQLAIQIQ